MSDSDETNKVNELNGIDEGEEDNSSSLLLSYPELNFTKKFYSNDGGSFEISLYGDLGPGSNPVARLVNISHDIPLNILMFSDCHFPFHDIKAVDIFLKCCQVMKHDLLVCGGDTLDMYGLSTFSKEQNKIRRSLDFEIKCFREFCQKLRYITQKPLLFLFGNHMDRYQKWLNSNAAITFVNDMQIDNLMGIYEYDNWFPNVGFIMFNACSGSSDFPDPNLIIHHGSISRKHAGSSSRGESENFGYISSISGHVHRLSVVHKRTARGIITMAESGTLRTLNPEYFLYPDWQQGFLYFTVTKNTVFCSPILIQDGTAYYNGVIFPIGDA